MSSSSSLAGFATRMRCLRAGVPVPLVHSAILTFEVVLPAETEYVREARRSVFVWLVNRCGMTVDRAEDVVLSVSELVANTIVHSRPRPEAVVMRGWCAHGHVRLENRGGRPIEAPLPLPPDGVPDLMETTGRGLFLVDALLVEGLGGKWGFAAEGAGTWCEVPLSAAEASVDVPRTGAL